MKKTLKNFDSWLNIHELWQELAEHYYNFSLKFKKELERNYNIDSGTDYANYMFYVGEIEH